MSSEDVPTDGARDFYTKSIHSLIYATGPEKAISSFKSIMLSIFTIMFAQNGQRSFQ